MQITASVRALYRIIGKIIGRQVFDRIANDENIDADPEKRRVLAQEVIDLITDLRHELLEGRDFAKLEAKIQEFFDKPEKLAIKQFAWVLEAYLLLNQSSTASAEVTKPKAILPDRLLMSKLIDTVRTKVLQEKHLAKVFEKYFSANLVLTAHPTAGIQPDYINHIKNMVSAIEKIASRIDPSEWANLSANKDSESLEAQVEDLIEDIELSISHMVRAKPYNDQRLEPINESCNFMYNMSEAWDVIPTKVQALEQELKKYLGDDFRLGEDFFRIHSWVARDIDGNPSVSYEQHMKALLQERIHFLTKYRVEVDKLWQSLSDDFTADEDLPSKTFFHSQEFKQLYDQLIATAEEIDKPNQAYRVVIDKLILAKLDLVITQLMQIDELNPKALTVMANFSVLNDLIYPLELIRDNKIQALDFESSDQSTGRKGASSTKEIDLLIRKAQVFGDFGSHGHSRQGRETLSLLVKYLTSLWEGHIDSKRKFVAQSAEVLEPIADEKLKKLFVQNSNINYGMLREKITLQFAQDDEKTQRKLLQTFDLLRLSELGAIRREIISMNQSYEDMLNVLVLAKVIGAFRPADANNLPWSRLEIVPLTEQIIDLRNSYKVTIEALCCPVWHQYLIAQNGRFFKMRGPSDSGKQNGFVASQWEMFRSKQLDTIVVEIFNAYLQKFAFDNDSDLEIWKAQAEAEVSESEVIRAAIEAFDKFFAEAFDKELWLRAEAELGFRKIKLINFDGWGEPVERGGGLEFEHTVKATQPLGSIPYYERTLQGGGAQQLASGLRTKQAVQDFVDGVTDIAVKRFTLNRIFDVNAFALDLNFIETMNRLVKIVRTALRSEILGLNLDDDQKISDEAVLRNYFRHVIKSPLVYLDLFNIASRPTSRSGSQIQEYLDDPSYANSLDQLAEKLDLGSITSILNDVRAIPYAAMFSLLGGNHVSFYGYDKVLEDAERYSADGKSKKTLLEWIKHFYHLDGESQEQRLMKHIIDSLERGIITADQNCYRKAHEIIERVVNPDYRSGDDLLILKLLQGEQATINFVAAVKSYKVADSNKVKIDELMQNNSEERDLLIARRNDAAVPRLGIAIAMSKIFAHAKATDLNPLDGEKIPNNLLDLLRKAFAAGASTFGNGCID